MADVLRAIDDARLRAEEERDIHAGIIIAFDRAAGMAVAEECLKHVADWHAHGVVGIDLHGDESAGPASALRRRVPRRARRRPGSTGACG